jgi:uncharacterized membrane protein
MSKRLAIVAALAVASLLSQSASATPTEAVRSAASTTVRGLEKAQDAVVHVAKAGVAGVSYGAGKAGEAVTHVAKKVGLPTEPGSPPKNTSQTQ